MSAGVLNLDEAAQRFAERLETREAARSGSTRAIARQAVARRLGVQPGTLENLRRGRLKGVRAWVIERLHAAVISEIKREIAALTHELETLGRPGSTPDPISVAQVEADLSVLKRLAAAGDNRGGHQG